MYTRVGSGIVDPFDETLVWICDSPSFVSPFTVIEVQVSTLRGVEEYAFNTISGIRYVLKSAPEECREELRAKIAEYILVNGLKLPQGEEIKREE